MWKESLPNQRVASIERVVRRVSPLIFSLLIREKGNWRASICPQQKLCRYLGARRFGNLGNFPGMLQTAFASHFRAGAPGSQTTCDPLQAFLPSDLADWIPRVIRLWF